MRTRFIMYPRELSKRSYCGNKTVSFILPSLFALLIAAPLNLNGQQSSLILFHSIILDSGTREPLTGAHYINMQRSAGAADSRGQVSFYAQPHDTVTFTCIGYKDFRMVISDTLYAREYTAGIFMSSDTLVIEGVVVVPRLGNIRAEIMSDRPPADQAMINASNNLRLSAYQGITSTAELGDPVTNYEMLRQKQRTDAIERGGIPSDKMIGLNPFAIIPLIYILVKGRPEAPKPPAPYLSARERQQIRDIHDSLIYKRK